MANGNDQPHNNPIHDDHEGAEAVKVKVKVRTMTAMTTMTTATTLQQLWPLVFIVQYIELSSNKF
jgi:hypothetical protein